ncbi:MAG: hypothetical protein MI919_18240, partial [Holophagales bacterium]|nr:hypothetical protein [Holophagales bacterium]
MTDVMRETPLPASDSAGRAPETLRWRGLRSRLLAFVLERNPFAQDHVALAFDAAFGLLPGGPADRLEQLERLRPVLREEIISRCEKIHLDGLPETTPRVSALERLGSATEALLLDADGFLSRESIRASFTEDERRELLGGMVLTRAVDNRLKQLFLGGEVRFGDKAFQGKGFRSLGQEGIYGA